MQAFKFHISKSLILFDLDTISNLDFNEELETDENNYQQPEKEDNLSKEMISKQIQGVRGSSNNEMKWGSASKILFDIPYSELLTRSASLESFSLLIQPFL